MPSSAHTPDLVQVVALVTWDAGIFNMKANQTSSSRETTSKKQNMFFFHILKELAI